MDSLDRLLKIDPAPPTEEQRARIFLWYHLRRYPDKKTANIKEIQDYFLQADRPIPSIELIRHAFLSHPTFRRGSTDDTFGINEGPGTGIQWFDDKFGPCFIQKPGPPDEGLPSVTQSVLSSSVVGNTTGYIECVANQVNGTYEKGWYDACAVMIRRLLETLIVEAFEHHNLAASIKNAGGDFFYLKDLIDKCLQQSAWNLTRNCKLAMPKLKDIGDKSAHSRRYNAHRGDIDPLLGDIRLVVQELVYLAELK